MSNKKRERFPVSEYFSGKEVAIADAIYYGDKKQLEQFINQGTEINHIGKEGFSYLMYAIMIENYEVTEFLLEKGADPNQLSPLMKTKFNQAREESEKMPLEMLPLETCCGASYPIKYMKLLIKYRANLNDNRTETPLHVAIMADDMEKVRYLLDSGANINQTYRSSTPIMTAAKIMSWHMMNYLLDRGADVFHVNRNGYTIGLYMQEYANRDAWTPDGRRRIEGLINRLKEKGVKFPVYKQTPTDSTGQVEKPASSSSTHPAIPPKNRPDANRHSWTLDDDDNWILS